MTLEQKAERLRELLRGCGPLAVAFSGGVDSSYLLAAAKDALGGRVLALTADSPLIPRAELEEARALCETLGVRQLVIPIEALAIPEVAKNPPERCYLCKRALFGALIRAAGEQGFQTLAEGSNLDDLSDYRPGLAAIAELGVRSPLREAGLTKAEIRALSKARGLSGWDKPSMACLASRIPYGDALTRETLAAVEQAEAALHALGFVQCRVRAHGSLARIELPPESLARLADDALRREIAARVRAAGFAYVSLDLEGYRMGSLNETLLNS